MVKKNIFVTCIKLFFSINDLLYSIEERNVIQIVNELDKLNLFFINCNKASIYFAFKVIL